MDDEKINILHHQIDLLGKQVGDLRVHADRATEGLVRPRRNWRLPIDRATTAAAGQRSGDRRND